jgi:NAD(P)-dependent dehydrogenase (short-subunit alcohol dehydrogenase family)
MQRFDERVALVTGAGSGIGRAVALRLASEGAAVACLDVIADTALATAELARSHGAAAVGLPCDVRDAVQVVAAFLAAEEALGVPDVLCNSAGIGGFSHSENAPIDEWDRIIGVNLTGTFLVCREFLARQGTKEATEARVACEGKTRPVIVNIASSAGLVAQPYSAAYAASKGGVVMLTKALAIEFVERGVRINAIAPGGVLTPLIASFELPEDSSRKLSARMIPPLGFATPEHIAAAVAFVASEESGTMTGAVVSIDGGTAA